MADLRITHTTMFFAAFAAVVTTSSLGCNLFEDYSSYADEPVGCMSGDVVACACAGGAEGMQTCVEDGTFGPCMCAEDIGGEDMPQDLAQMDEGVPPDDGFPDSAPDMLDELRFRPLEGDTYAQVSAGIAHTCAVADGAVTCWGSDADGQIGAPSDRSAFTFTQVSAGGGHTCALTDTEEGICWGRNNKGQLARPLDEQVPPLEVLQWLDPMDTYALRQIAVGREHSMALSTVDRAVGWGRSDERQTRPGFDSIRELMEPHPEAVRLGVISTEFSTLSVGADHICGLSNAGDIECWGSNIDGQRGPEPCAPRDDACTSERRVYTLPGGDTYQAVGAGGRHTCAISTEGVVTCWGAGDRGQLGDATSRTMPSSPDRVDVTTPVALTHLGRSLGDTQCGWGDDGAVVCWGDNRFGQANPLSEDAIIAPTVIDLPAPAQAVTSGGAHTCALLQGGYVRCWGEDAEGQVGAYSVYAE